MRIASFVLGLVILVVGAIGCGSGPTGTSCINPSFTFCAGSCYDLTSDPSHCGSCSNACVSGEACVAGTCRSGVDAGASPDAFLPPQHDAATLPDAASTRTDAWVSSGAGMCESCDVASCASGLTCSYRRCDGVALCFDATNGCNGCPTISDFEPGCGSSSDCGPLSACIRLSTDFGLGCAHVCTTAADCTSAPTGFDDRVQQWTGGHCWMPCDPVTAPTCPFSLTCRADHTCGL